MTTAPLALTREQILAYRQAVNEIGERLPPGGRVVAAVRDPAPHSVRWGG